MTQNFKGFVYLIQPPEFVSTNVFKIGYSCQENLNRIRQYGSNTYIICITTSDNAPLTEKKLIKAFRSKYTIHKGKEYFVGEDVKLMERFFYSVAKSDAEVEDKLGMNAATNVETNIDVNLEANNKRFECSCCNYKTNRKDNYDRHMKSKRHIGRNEEKHNEDNNINLSEELFMHLVEQNKTLLNIISNNINSFRNING